MPSSAIAGNSFVRTKQQVPQNIDLGAYADVSWSQYRRVTFDGDVQRRDLLDDSTLFQRMASPGANRG